MEQEIDEQNVSAASSALAVTVPTIWTRTEPSLTVKASEEMH